MGRPLIGCALLAAAALVACGRSPSAPGNFHAGQPFADLHERVAELSSQADRLRSVRPSLLKDSDGDGLIDKFDPDIDGDGIPNLADADALNPLVGVSDRDLDGIPDLIDFDEVSLAGGGTDDCNDILQRPDCARLQAEIFAQAKLMVTYEGSAFTQQELQVIHDTLEPLKAQLSGPESWMLIKRVATVDTVRAAYDADWNILSIRPLESLRSTFNNASQISNFDGAEVYAAILRHEFGHRYQDLHNDVFRKFLAVSGWTLDDPTKVDDVTKRQVPVGMSYDGHHMEVSGDLTDLDITADWLAGVDPKFPSVYAKYGVVEHFAENFAADLIAREQWDASPLLKSVFKFFDSYQSVLKSVGP